MSFRWITPTIHGVIDYVSVVALLVLPGLVGLGVSSPIAPWPAWIGAGVVLVASLLTDYRLGLIRLIPFPVHLALDGLVAAAFLLTPSVLGFVLIDAWFYWVLALAVVLVTLMTRTRAAPMPTPRPSGVRDPVLHEKSVDRR